MRMKNALIGDMRFQWKYGFYLIYAILCTIYIAIINSLPVTVKPQVTAILIFSDPAAMGLFFMGAIILLEKSQRVLNAVAVSPLKHSEYILAKVLSLAFISALVAAVIALATGAGNIPLIIIGTIISSAVFTLLGIIAATKIESLNQFMVVSVGIDIICFIPPILAVVRPDWSFLKLFPFDAAMRLIYGSSASVLLDMGINLLLIILLYLICHRQVKKMFQRVGGVKL